MLFIDTHCHLNMMVDKNEDQPLKPEHVLVIDTIVEQAKAVGVGTIINVGTSLAETKNSILLAQRYPQVVVASAGIHPCDIKPGWEHDFAELERLVEKHAHQDVVAIGETGLDYYHSTEHKKEQQKAFIAHIKLALKHNLALIVHIRSAAEDTLALLEPYATSLRGVNHCFQGEQWVADKLLSWGWYLGIDAPITYPNNRQLRETLAHIPLTSVILETDAPFLPPQQFRGKQNSPVYIPLFAPVVAMAMKVSVEHLAATTTAAARTLFCL